MWGWPKGHPNPGSALSRTQRWVLLGQMVLPQHPWAVVSGVGLSRARHRSRVFALRSRAFHPQNRLTDSRVGQEASRHLLSSSPPSKSVPGCKSSLLVRLWCAALETLGDTAGGDGHCGDLRDLHTGLKRRKEYPDIFKAQNETKRAGRLPLPLRAPFVSGLLEDSLTKTGRAGQGVWVPGARALLQSCHLRSRG